jgi:hypothetical protein
VGAPFCVFVACIFGAFGSSLPKDEVGGDAAGAGASVCLAFRLRKESVCLAFRLRKEGEGPDLTGTQLVFVSVFFRAISLSLGIALHWVPGTGRTLLCAVSFSDPPPPSPIPLYGFPTAFPDASLSPTTPSDPSHPVYTEFA